eukprot:441367-Pelagomonas_calceolata.AAC.3
MSGEGQEDQNYRTKQFGLARNLRIVMAFDASWAQAKFMTPEKPIDIRLGREEKQGIMRHKLVDLSA